MADLQAIKKQVEFYFSDSNYRRDTFLRAAAETDPKGFVPIATLLTFNKLRNLTTDEKVVAEAIKDSEPLVLSEDGVKVKRSEPLPDVDTSAQRTLYVKGYPSEESITIEVITEQFSKYGKVAYVKLRRNAEKAFKGSCFVEFETEDAVKAVVAEANEGGKMNLSYNDKPFDCIMPFVEWHANKQAKATKRSGNAPVVGEKRKADGDADEDASPKDAALDYPKGMVVKLTNVPTNTDSFALKTFLKTIVEVKFVEYTVGTTEACVRFGDESSVTSFVAKLSEGNVTFTPVEGGESFKLAGTLIEGEEESTYWAKVFKDSKGRPQGGRGGSGGRGGRGRGGGRGGGRGRGRKSSRH